MRRIVLLVSLLLAACVIGCLGIAAYLVINPALVGQAPAELAPLLLGTPVSGGGQGGPTFEASGPGSGSPVFPPGDATLAAEAPGELARLQSVEIPRNNPVEVVPRLKGQAPVSLATPTAPKVYQVGEKSSFWVSRDITGTYELVTSTLRYANPVVYMWVEDGINLSDAEIKRGADTFADKTYPTDRKSYGSEWSPGTDNDPHIFVLNTRFRNAAGYFSSSDEYPPSIKPFSNQHEIIYINSDAIRPGGSAFDSVMAHEFGHMIHWFQNGHESTWIVEGLGDMAIRLNGLNREPLEEFTRQPNLQLTGWTDIPNQSLAHYEASYLFLAFGLDHLGEGFIHDIVSSGTRDIATVQKSLDKYAGGMRFNDFFSDWVVANIANNLPAAGERYAYKQDRPRISPQTVAGLPYSINSAVSQYGTQYFALENIRGDVQIDFKGDTSARVIPATAHSGQFFWWGNRADMSDTSLTRTVDLDNAKTATLKFWTWYKIEDGFDYAYASVSADGGRTWKTLKGQHTTNSDPNGANLGNGITGSKGGAWIQEQMDLTPFVGTKILLRFEYVTDDAFVDPGFAVDDIEIPEINWRDDAEKGEGDWQARGFVRTDNLIPATFVVQAIEFGNQFQVERLVLDRSNAGKLTIKGLLPGTTRVVVSVSGTTPITWERSNYRLDVHSVSGP